MSNVDNKDFVHIMYKSWPYSNDNVIDIFLPLDTN